MNACPQVRVHRTMFDRMALLLTALTTANNFRLDFCRMLTILAIIKIFVIFGVMLTKFTPRLIPVILTTAPPNRTTPFWLVRPARPIEILFVEILLAAILASFLDLFLRHNSLSTSNPDQLEPQPVFLLGNQFKWNLKFRNFIDKSFTFTFKSFIFLF